MREPEYVRATHNTNRLQFFLSVLSDVFVLWEGVFLCCIVLTQFHVCVCVCVFVCVCVYASHVCHLKQSTFEWEERPGKKTWKLTQDTKDKHVFRVDKACPYYQSGHKNVIAKFEDSGKLIGLLGPNGTMFTLQVFALPLWNNIGIIL